MKIKNVKLIVILILFMLCIQIPQLVYAKTSFNIDLKGNPLDLKKGEEIIVTLSLKNLEEVNDGINAYKATLQYDKNLFEEVKQSDFMPLNSWGELLYNSENGEFISIKKGGTTENEEVVSIKLIAKKDIIPSKTVIKISDVVASEGKEDIFTSPEELNVNIIYEQEDDKEFPNNNGNNNYDDTLAGGKLPVTGVNPILAWILIIIQLLVLIAIILYLNSRKNKISNKKRFLFVVLGVVVIGIQLASTINAINAKGELNDDGKIDYKDVTLLQQHLIGLKLLNEELLSNADMNSDSKISVTDLTLLVHKIEKSLDYEVSLSSGMTEFYANKNEEIILKFSSVISYDAKIDEVKINDKYYKVNKVEDSNEYFVKINVGNTSGIKEFKFSKVKLNVGKEVKVDFTEKVEVLKDIPTVENYEIEEIIEESKVKVKFNLVDKDNSIESCFYELVEIINNEESKDIKSEDVIKGQNEIILDVEENKNYQLYLYVNYNLDSDKLGEHDEDKSGSIYIKKDIKLNTEYNFIFDELKLYDVNNKETNVFSKNDNIILKFNSTNVFNYKVEKISINGKEYDVKKINSKYEVNVIADFELGKNSIIVDYVVLENGKKFNLNKEDKIEIDILKMKPSIENLSFVESDNNKLKVSFNIIDEDNSILKRKFIIKNEDKDIVFEKSFDTNDFNTECLIEDMFVSKYIFEVVIDYDLTLDNSDTIKSYILYTGEMIAKNNVNIIKSSVSSEIAEKGEDITLTYQIKSNIEAEITDLVVNNIETPVKILDNNNYEVTIPIGNNAGVKDIILSKVIFDNNIIVDVNDIQKVEVLKSDILVDNYIVEEYADKEKVGIKFDIVDLDEAFENGCIKVLDTDGEVYYEKEILNTGENYFEIPVEENKEYTLNVIATYVKNYDRTNVIEDKVLLEKTIHVILDYSEKISNIKTYTIDNVETKYFERNEKINVEFEFTNSTKYYPEIVSINGEEYTLISKDDNTYNTTIKHFETQGVKEIKVDYVVLNNRKKLEFSNNNITNIEILKIAPIVSDFNYNDEANDIVKVNFTVSDLENSATNVKVTIEDKDENIILEKDNLSVGENEVQFTLNESEEYLVKIYATYDLDSNILSQNDNEYIKDLIDTKEIIIKQELVELKDITSVQLYTKNGDRVEEVTEITLDNFDYTNYIAKITMKQMPVLYSEIKDIYIAENNFYLVLNYDNAVQYNGEEKTNNVFVKFGEIVDGKVSNIEFAQLIEMIQKNPTAEITLTKDLDAKSVTVKTGTYLENFKGKINGNGHVISNLSKPLFNQLENVTIENLIIEDGKLSNSGRGLLANSSSNTIVKNVHIINSSISNSSDAGTGVFIGYVDNNSNILECSANNVSISSAKRVGGFVGYLNNGSIIDNCYIKGTVIASNDAVGGIAGQISGVATIQNSYVDIDFNMTASWATGGIAGYSEGSKLILKNNISLARGTVGNRVMDSSNSYNRNNSINNYEIKESNLNSNKNGDKIIEISETEINADFIENILNLDPNIWRLEEVTSSNMPSLRNLDPFDKDNIVNIVTPENSEVYIPNIDRLKNMDNYIVSKEIAYHNINLLMPFYDSKYIVYYGNKISDTDVLNTTKIKMIIPYDESGNVILGLTDNNYEDISKIKVIFEDENTIEYDVTFKKKLNKVSVYNIENLDIIYNYNKFILDTNISTVNEIIESVKSLDYSDQIQNVTEESESRLYVDYYNETTSKNIENKFLNIIANIDEYNLYLDNDILKEKIKQDITNNLQLEKILYSYNYFSKWYNMEMGGTSLAEIIFTKVNDVNKEMTILDLVNSTISQGVNVRNTNNSVGFFNNVIKPELGNKGIKMFLEYFIKILDGYSNANDWFTDNFEGILNEKPAIGKEDEIRYRAWELLNARNHLLLPILSAPQEDMYIISVPSQIVIGSLNRYGQHYKEDDTDMRNLIDNYATMIGNFYGISATYINNAVNILNSHAHIQYDTRFNFPENAPTPGKQEPRKNSRSSYKMGV